MWTTEIIQIKKLNGVPYIMVNFLKDGVVIAMENFVMKDNVDSYWLKRQVKSKLDALKTADTLSSTLTVGAIDTTVTSEPVTPPTQAQLDKEEWFRDYSKWQRVLKAIEAQILTGSETAVVALKSKVQTNFKAAYLADI